MFRVLIFVLFMFSCSASKDRKYRYNYVRELNGWVKLHEIPANWQEARLRCRLEGSVLMSPLNEKYRSAMMSLMFKSRSLFTGIHSTFSKGDYFSIEGVPLRNIPRRWAKNEPDNYEDKENCLRLLPDGTLADEDCTETYHYMCFKKRTKDTIVNECGTVDKDYVLDQRTGSCYKFHRIPRSWSEAHMACSAEDAHLAVINSEVEATVIRELFAKNPPSSMIGNFWKDVAFMGFLGWQKNGDWLTVYGETLNQAGYSRFASGEPNNSTTGEYCGAIYRTALLNDLWCENSYAFICEKRPNESFINMDGDRAP